MILFIQVSTILDELGFPESIIEKFRNEKVESDKAFSSVVYIPPSLPGIC